MTRFDHVVLVAPDLEKAIQDFEERTGCRPVMGGSHVGFGTRNALIAFEANSPCYLEILAPDPQQAPLEGKLGGELAKVESMQPIHYAIRSSNLPRVQEFARKVGLQPEETIKDLSRTKHDDSILEWKMLFLDRGGLVPFYLDWLDCVHPTEGIPMLGPVVKIGVGVAQNEALMRLLENVDCIECREGDSVLEVTFQCPKGVVSFSATSPRGLRI